MTVDYEDSGSERELVKALVRVEDLAIECLREGCAGLVSLMEDHAADIRASLARGKQPVRRS